MPCKVTEKHTLSGFIYPCWGFLLRITEAEKPRVLWLNYQYPSTAERCAIFLVVRRSSPTATRESLSKFTRFRDQNPLQPSYLRRKSQHVCEAKLIILQDLYTGNELTPTRNKPVQTPSERLHHDLNVHIPPHLLIREVTPHARDHLLDHSGFLSFNRCCQDGLQVSRYFLQCLYIQVSLGRKRWTSVDHLLKPPCGAGT